MRKIFILINFIVVLSATTNLFAQWAQCTPDPSVTDPNQTGIRYPDLLPVAFKNEPYNTVLTIISPVKANFWGDFNVTITKIKLLEVRDMPTGLTWETNSNNADDFLYSGEKYCIRIDGVPTSVPGVIDMDVYANAWIKALWVLEVAAPGNPRNGGSVRFTLCNSLNLNLGNDTTITTAGEFTLSAKQYNSYHKYLWQDGSTNSTFKVKGSELGVGVHKIKVTVSDTVGTTGHWAGEQTRCFKTDSIMVTVVEQNSIDLTKTGELKIFPNPTNGNVFINLPEKYIGSRFSLLDTRGSIVFSAIIYEEESYFDLNELCKGYYIVVIENNGTKSVSKLLIE